MTKISTFEVKSTLACKSNEGWEIKTKTTISMLKPNYANPGV